MRARHAATMLFCLLLLGLAAPRVQAQNLPQDCQEAQEVRSPQAQVDLLTSCLETGRLNPNERATTLKQRAVAYMHLGQHQRAVDDVTQAMKLKPGDPDNYYLRGVSNRALGRHQQSVDDSSRAIGMDSNFAAAYANRAFSYKALGRTSMAKSDARRATELDPKVKVPWF